MVRHVALVSESQAVSASVAASIAAAVQKQVTRDFSPLWQVDATLSYFAALNDVPIGYWPIIIVDQLSDPNAGGFHTDKNGQPYALVLSQGQVSVDVSHECLEMLADPFGSRTNAGDSIKPGQGRVEYLVEVCDPCEGDAYTYMANGLPVSDFYTPHFFDPVASTAVRYDFTGAIKKPLQLLKQGYISWLDPQSQHMWQAFYFGAKITFKDLGQAPPNLTLREWVDSHTNAKVAETVSWKRKGRAEIASAHADASKARASALRDYANWKGE
jgi:hypothetical protein